MELVYLNSNEEIRIYEERIESDNALETIQSLKFISNRTVVIPGYLQCHYKYVEELRNALINLRMSQDIEDLLELADRAIIGEVAEKQGRTYYQELEFTLKELKKQWDDVNICMKGFCILSQIMYQRYPLIDEALDLIDSLYHMCVDYGTDILEREDIVDTLLIVNSYPDWYVFLGGVKELAQLYEMVVIFFGEIIDEYIKNNYEN